MVKHSAFKGIELMIIRVSGKKGTLMYQTSYSEGVPDNYYISIALTEYRKAR